MSSKLGLEDNEPVSNATTIRDVKSKSGESQVSPRKPRRSGDKSGRSSSEKSKNPYLGYAKQGPWILRPYRRFVYWWRNWGIGSKLLHGSAVWGRKIFSFRGTTFNQTVAGDKQRVRVRTWPSTSTMLNPLWWGIWSCQFFWRWLKSRQFASMLLAVPAAALAFGVMAISFGESMTAPGTESARLRGLLSTSAKGAGKDLGKARLAADALVRLNPDSSEYAFTRALVEVEDGNVELAELLMTQLATYKGSDKAALWLAKSVSSEKPFEEWSQEKKREYFDWLVLAVNNNPNDPISRRLLGDVLRSAGSLKEAHTVMLPIADTSNENSCIVAYLEHELGMTESAEARVGRLERDYVDRIQAKPQDIEARSQWAMLLILLGREPEAVQVLSEGLVWAEDPNELRGLRTSLTEALVLDAKKLQEGNTTPQGLMASLERLREAMSIDATNKSLQKAVIEACVKASKSSNRELLILREAVIQGVSSEASHFILGTAATLKGDVEMGKQHLEVAVKNNPNLPGLLNNLAYSLMLEKEPDLERALRLSNAAVNALPGNAFVRETRAQILLRLEKPFEAIADFEFALSAPEIRKVVRKGLIQAYEAVGNEEYANRHRQLLSRGR